jgi:hypothetical protein
MQIKMRIFKFPAVIVFTYTLHAWYVSVYIMSYTATLTPDVKVIPGYINLTIDIARSMNGGSVDNFHTYVNQLVAVTEMFPQKPNVADFLEGRVTMFEVKSAPNSHFV